MKCMVHPCTIDSVESPGTRSRGETMSTKMTREEREAFLADVHVAVLSVAQEGRGPLTVPVWYSYTPGGEVHVITGANSVKAHALRAAGQCSLCVQSEMSPYKYVSVEGTVTP